MKLDFTGFPYDVKEPTFLMYLDRMANLDLSILKYCVWHHTGNREADVTATSTNRYHIEEKGWAGIGYHMMVRWSGLVELGRPLTKRGVHASKVNPISIGVSLSGNFSITDGSARPDQYRSAVLLARLISKTFPGIKHVRHKDVGSTACNGDYFPWDKFISDVYKEDEEVRTAYHVVVGGDSFGKISTAYKVSVSNLTKWNPHIIDPNLIRKEHGGDVVFLAQPTAVEVDWAIMRNAWINCMMNHNKLKAYLDSEIVEKDRKIAEYGGLLDNIHQISKR